MKSLDFALMCGISESLIFEELTFRADVILVHDFTGVKSLTSITGRDVVPKSLLYFFSTEKKYTIFLVKISKVFKMVIKWNG